jgi:hypothetical protein
LHSDTHAERFFVQDELRSDPVWGQHPRLWEEIFYDAVQAEQVSFGDAPADISLRGSGDGGGVLPHIALAKLIPFCWTMTEHGVSAEATVAFADRMCGVHGIGDDERAMVIEQVRASADRVAAAAAAVAIGNGGGGGGGGGGPGSGPGVGSGATTKGKPGMGGSAGSADDDDGPDTFEGTFDERLRLCHHLKDVGNELFKDKSFSEAAQQYGKALRLVGDPAAAETMSDRKRAEALVLSCHLNAAACALQDEDAASARWHAERALVLNPTNARARFRLGLALARQGKIVPACRQLRFVLRSTPGDDHLRREFDHLLAVVRLARAVRVAADPTGEI